MAFSHNSREDRPYYLPLLIIISLASHVPFVLHGYGEIDAAKIGVSVMDMLKNGSHAAFSNFYFTDVVPLYIAYLSWFMKLLDHNYSYLPIVMNYTNAAFGTLTVIPAFLLIRQLFHNSGVAFCTVLALIFAPSFYQATIMGFPHLIAFFFLLVSLCFYIYALDHDLNNKIILLMFLSYASLSISFLFKSDIVLITGIFFGLLIIRKVKGKEKILGTISIVFAAGISFLILRGIILGPLGGTTMSKEGLSKWYEFSLILPSAVGYYIAQAKPIAYGAGIATFCLGGIVFLYNLFKRNAGVLTFILSWAALPTLFWLVMIGNNARHNMTTVLPLIAMIVLFFHEKAPRFKLILTLLLISSNLLLTAPSFSIIKPSGNLFQSNSLLEERMNIFHARAKEIVNIDEDKIVVLGTYHNPHVIIELLHTAPSYHAVKLGREDYKITINDKEYVFIYFVVVKPEDLKEGIDDILKRYQLHDHVFVSANYDLTELNRQGLKTKKIDIITRAEL